jgi:hypothetical protein
LAARAPRHYLARHRRSTGGANDGFGPTVTGENPYCAAM